MKITSSSGARGVRPGAQKRSGGPANAGKFAEHLGGAVSTAQADATAGPGSVAALLAVQAAGDALEGKREAYARADGLLKRLEAVRLALLEGRLDVSALRRLQADMQREQSRVADPDLAELVAEIELRAAVELAKRGL